MEKPRITSHNNGKLVVMECKVRSDPEPQITWYREGKLVTESTKITISTKMIEKEIYYIKLELNDPGTEDSGLYKCNIKNIHGELNANLTLNIEIIPVIKEKPKVIKIIKKKTVIVECKVLSKFAPDCTWYKESEAVKEDSRHNVHVEQVKDVSKFSSSINISHNCGLPIFSVNMFLYNNFSLFNTG